MQSGQKEVVLEKGEKERKEGKKREREKKRKKRGSLGDAAVWRLPWTRGAILETRDRFPRRAPGAWSLLLPLPVSLPLSLSLSLCVCDYHK